MKPKNKKLIVEIVNLTENMKITIEKSPENAPVLESNAHKNLTISEKNGNLESEISNENSENNEKLTGVVEQVQEELHNGVNTDSTDLTDKVPVCPYNYNSFSSLFLHCDIYFWSSRDFIYYSLYESVHKCIFCVGYPS